MKRSPNEQPMTGREIADRWQPAERHIKIHGPDEFEAMRRAGRLAAEVLDFITPHVVPGVVNKRRRSAKDAAGSGSGSMNTLRWSNAQTSLICGV